MSIEIEERVQKFKEAIKKVCIDHHLNPDPFADHAIIDEEATSTGEIVYRLLLHLRERPDLSEQLPV